MLLFFWFHCFLFRQFAHRVVNSHGALHFKTLKVATEAEEVEEEGEEKS